MEDKTNMGFRVGLYLSKKKTYDGCRPLVTRGGRYRILKDENNIGGHFLINPNLVIYLTHKEVK